MSDLLNKIVDKHDLTYEEAYRLFNNLLNESEIRIGAYLAALQTKGFTSEEIAGFARAMRDNAVKVDLGSVCDTCGTGGDGSSTINVSTAVSILLSCFKKVAKHGNVSITSKSGSANVLEALNIKIDSTPDEAKRMIDETNFVFLFAPKYHPALKKIMPVRKELRIKTIFNILGPLANPANPDYQIIGVNSHDLVEKVGNALKLLGVKKALVVYGNGLDELNPNNYSTILEINDNKKEDGNKIYKIHPSDIGLIPSKPIPCNSPDESAKRIISVFEGKKGNSEITNGDRNFILLNAAGALYASDVASDYKEGLEIAENAIDEGIVLNKLREIQNYR
ncbi:anthranilate phosphoribosyltransferase [Methanothermococcus okinawensis]|uniref:Anthranilate phosphoribosyltransferase n=1 Tax=Methanothermococcus okinawensis (strain DSM 14208 / JCM 11175 / IH1) TaxID=647113 RepID=F8ANJ8_METOI|nr:anthranilate phosphoribosyltransferase [Methanothermococcus okinawensis]AEH07052.1 Anthranilate phosphoribosyltransferase [Methanothermococcus okinawensis IH1]